MDESLEMYMKEVAAQQEEILEHLAWIGVAGRYDREIPVPDGDSPLAETLAAIRMIAESLESAARERDEALRQARERAETIARQSQAIMELSTPVMEIWGKILILPLIGTIDTQRAKQTTENLLEAIARTRALAVIVDITGVPVVDTVVAGHLLKSIEASRLLGSEVILTGISPSNAQTLVKLGVDLGKVVAMSSLGSGLAAALDIIDSKVVRKAG